MVPGCISADGQCNNTVLPSPTIIPEAFMDTMIVNGTASLRRTAADAVRFRILNACNDRMLNLQLYKADPDGICRDRRHRHESGRRKSRWCRRPQPRDSTPTWPKDGRDGGVPDPTTAGPDFWQIGNEGRFPGQVRGSPQPVDYDYNRRSVTFGAVTSKSLYLPPAVRADVIVDLSKYAAGDTLILYNDAPAPMPLYDTRYDYFTDCPDQTAIGGAPTIPAGFGPNTRTVMQIRITTPTITCLRCRRLFLTALTASLPKAYAAAQEAPIVPESAFNAAYGTTYGDNFMNIADETLNVTGATQTVARS